ncbi:MAG: glycine cleavage system aminomethyltransferase GcvT [Flavobacteriaceae bacterium]|nr:glycine cleavage system aminomethyltransferase GcvT [Flavobacteriaceae bacterium]
MKKTSLNKIHHNLGAKMVQFAGFEMPILYKGINLEHKAVRKSIGLFDVSHMGEFFIEGENAKQLLQKLCSNDISKLICGKAQYNYFPNKNGGVIDDLIVYKLEENKYLLVVNASNIEKNWNWIKKYNYEYNAEIKNLSDDYSLLAIQGPLAIDAMQKLTNFDLNIIPNYSFKIDTFAGIKNTIIATTGYTGSGGLEIYLKNEKAESAWNSIMKAGASFGIEPVGLGARDTLRIEMGFCLYGNEINENQSPIEAGLSWITKPEKKCINYKSLKKEMLLVPKKKLIGFELIEKGIPRKDYSILNLNKKNIGFVSSGTYSPSLEKGIGLGYIYSNSINIRNQIYIQIRNKLVKANQVAIPFI